MNVQNISIEKLRIGDNVINLGEVLEVEERESRYDVIIWRMNAKQVWGFEKDKVLVIETK